MSEQFEATGETNHYRMVERKGQLVLNLLDLASYVFGV